MEFIFFYVLGFQCVDLLLFLKIVLLSTFMAAFCASLGSDEIAPMETEGENSIRSAAAADVIHDGRPKRHRPFLAGLLVG